MQRRTFLSASILGALAIAVDVPALASGSDEPGYSVINAGVGGNNTNDLLKRIDKDCLAHAPELTVLMIGTNDMNSMKYIPLEQYRENLSTIIKKIRAKKSKVLLMTICPFIEEYLFTRHNPAHYGTEGPSGRRAEVNRTIRELAAKHKTSLLDLGALFDKGGQVGLGKHSLIQNEVNTHKTDGVHPTPDGYRFIGLAVYQYIIYNRLPKSRIVCFGDSITAGDGGVDKESYPAYLQRFLLPA
ncbi:SGNH/GDSL hydrolase family protein [Chitinophaga sp. MM2321]|uniref:SGNH/GDSL hydrolase family protein n=1 Tax=Chitinophaga sp. MM2321 TaxID=3137178 RepID=UPI0032D56B6C